MHNHSKCFHTKQEERRKLQAENDKNTIYSDKALGEISESGEGDDEPVPREEGDSGIDANSQVIINNVYYKGRRGDATVVASILT